MEASDYFPQVLNKRVLVIGDAMVDKYTSGTANRISPDAPVPVLDIEDNQMFIGAVGLVVKYVQSLGGVVDLCTVVGPDFEGEFFSRELQNLNIGLKGVCNVETCTPQVSRIKARGQHLLRMERKYELSPEIRAEVNENILEFVNQNIQNADVVLLLDYDAGLLSRNYLLIENILATSNKAGIKAIARPEKANYALFTGVDIAKFNVNLAVNIVGVNSINETSIRITASKLMNEMQCRGLYLSFVDDNSFCVDEEQFEVIPPWLHHHGKSYVGSGSASVAALTLLTAAGAPLSVAANVATVAGALSAQLQPVTFFSLAKLQEALERGSVDESES